MLFFHENNILIIYILVNSLLKRICTFRIENSKGKFVVE